MNPNPNPNRMPLRTTLRTPLRVAGAALVVGSLALVAGCASGGSTEASAGDSTAAATGVLSGVCPATVVIQTDWEPESEHGGVYQLLGDDYTVDVDKKAVTGELMDGDTPTGVDVEIRIGGSSVGYTPVQSLLYQDTDILMGYERVSETIPGQADAPVTSIFSTLEKSPYAIYWDPATYPDAKTIEDLKADDVKIFMGSTATVWQDYLVGTGVMTQDQIDQSDAPKPATFIAAGGKVAEAGFASAEPYLYEVESPEWQKPVALQLIDDTGFKEYFQSMVVRSDDVTGQADCLKALVPIMQQAEVDYVTDPTATNAVIVDLVDQYQTGWIYTADQAQWAIDQQKELGLVADGEDGTFGSYDDDRVQGLIDIVGEYTDTDVSGITPGDLVTNQFLDTSITLP